MMIVLAAALGATLLAAGAEATLHDLLFGGRGVASGDLTFITREWVWSDGDITTTFTAYGPFEQVNQLDPQGNPLACQECTLVSSTEMQRGDETQPMDDR
jgi:hypothetical protein